MSQESPINNKIRDDMKEKIDLLNELLEFKINNPGESLTSEWNEYLIMSTTDMFECLSWAFDKSLSPDDQHIKRIVKNIYKAYGMDTVATLTHTDSGQLNSLVFNVLQELTREEQLSMVIPDGVQRLSGSRGGSTFSMMAADRDMPKRRTRKYRKRRKTGRKKTRK